MITPLQVRKALSMRESRMSWPAIAETIGEKLDDLVAAVEKETGRIIRPEALKPTAADPAKDSERRTIVEGFTVISNAPPPPPHFRSAPILALIQKLKVGDKVEGIKRPQAASIKKGLMQMFGWGAEHRVSPKGPDLVDLWVLAEPTRRQREMSVAMKQRHAARIASVTKSRNGKKA